MIIETNKRVNEALKLERAIHGIQKAMKPLQDELRTMLECMTKQERGWFMQALEIIVQKEAE